MSTDHIILWEAHRAGGGGFEMPESCTLSFEYGWLHGGRPEADVNMTKDNVMVSLHDSTLNRIARNLSPEFRDKPISEITWAELQQIDVGWDNYPNQHVPSMEMLFKQLQAHPERAMVIDYKNVDLQLLADMMHHYDVAAQITFASYDRNLCRRMKQLAPQIRTKHWLGGSAAAIERQFTTDQSEDFQGLTEIQLHLNGFTSRQAGTWRYDLSHDFITEALRITVEKGVLLQAAPWDFDNQSLIDILNLGVRSFAVDYPHKFTQACAEFFGARW